MDSLSSYKRPSSYASTEGLVVCTHVVLASSTTGLTPSSRPDSHSTSEALTPTTPTSGSQNRLGGAPSVNIISGLASGPGMEHMKAGGLAGLLGPPPKAPRGRKKIKAENPTGPLLVVPYPILADQGCVTVAPKEGKTYRLDIIFSGTHFVQVYYQMSYDCPQVESYIFLMLHCAGLQS